MNQLYTAASILNASLTICVIIGGYLAMRSGKRRQAGEIQGQVIEALQAELEALQRRVDSLERENTRLTQIMSLIKQALRQRGLAISIDGDLVTISDHGASQSARIREEQ